MDLYATLADVLGGSAPDGLDSKAYPEVLIGNDTLKGRETLILEAQGRLALKEGDYVLIRHIQEATRTRQPSISA